MSMAIAGKERTSGTTSFLCNCDCLDNASSKFCFIYIMAKANDLYYPLLVDGTTLVWGSFVNCYRLHKCVCGRNPCFHDIENKASLNNIISFNHRPENFLSWYRCNFIIFLDNMLQRLILHHLLVRWALLGLVLFSMPGPNDKHI